MEDILQSQVNSIHDDLLNKGHFPTYVFVLGSERVMKYLSELNEGLNDKRIQFYQQLKNFNQVPKGLQDKLADTFQRSDRSKIIERGIFQGQQILNSVKEVTKFQISNFNSEPHYEDNKFLNLLIGLKNGMN